MSLPTELMWNIFSNLVNKIGESQTLDKLSLIEYNLRIF
jgi:hypothetical protein